MGKFGHRSAIASIFMLCGILSASAQAQQTDSATLCSVEGQVIDAVTSTPVRKATLTLRQKAKAEGAVSVPDSGRTTAPDAEGRFRFQNIPPGEYSLYAEARGYLVLWEFSTSRKRHSGTAFSLAAGQKLSGLVLRLTPSAAVSGRIVDEDGDPLGMVEVQLFKITYFSGRKELSRMGVPNFVRTDDRGVYRIGGVTPGRYYLSASYYGKAPNWPPDNVRYVRS